MQKMKTTYYKIEDLPKSIPTLIKEKMVHVDFSFDMVEMKHRIVFYNQDKTRYMAFWADVQKPDLEGKK